MRATSTSSSCFLGVFLFCSQRLLSDFLLPPSALFPFVQKDFTMREELQQSDVERWLGFITFLCEVFGTMRSSTGEPFRVLVCPIYTCLREVSRVGGGGHVFLACYPSLSTERFWRKEKREQICLPLSALEKFCVLGSPLLQDPNRECIKLRGTSNNIWGLHCLKRGRIPIAPDKY